MAEFKDMLVYFRKKNGMSQAELARKVSVAPTTIASYEQGKRHPSFEIEEAIADVFNVNLNTLRGKDTIKEIPTTLDDGQSEMLLLFNSLNEIHRQTALEHLKFLKAQENQLCENPKEN